MALSTCNNSSSSSSGTCSAPPPPPPPLPDQLEAALLNERRRRRQQRIVQVRAQCNEFAGRVREQAKAKKQRQEEARKEQQRQDDLAKKREELAALQEGYKAALQGMGQALAGAKEEQRYQGWLKGHREEQRKKALERGAEAWRREKRKRETDRRIRDNKTEVRRAAVLAENLRTKVDRVATQAEEKKDNQENAMAANQKKVSFDVQGSRKDEKSFLSGQLKNDENCCKRLPLSDMGNANEMDMESRRRFAAEDARERAKRRGDEAMRREHEERRRLMIQQESQREQLQRRVEFQPEMHAQQQQYPQEEPVTPSSTSSSSSSGVNLSTIHEVTEPTTSRSHQGLDLYPVRGPPSASSSGLTDSSSSPSIIAAPLFPPPMGGPASAFGPPTTGLDPADMDNIRQLLDRVERQKRELTEPDGGIQLHQGAGSGQKNTDPDRDFVARVLGVPVQELKRRQEEQLYGEESFRYEQQRHHVQVNINVQEMSVTQDMSESSITATQRRVYVEASSSSSSPASSSSNSTDLVAEEKFLTGPLHRSHIRGQQQQQQTEFTDYRTIQTLIHELSNTSISMTPNTKADCARQKKLRSYIEKLLSMKREEINDLSVTETSIDTSEATTISSTSTSSDSSALVSQRLSHMAAAGESFVASTPASILSSSNSTSNTSGGSKTVRFKDQMDAKSTDIAREVARVEQRTQDSILEIRKAYEIKKREIEKALERRTKKKQKNGSPSSASLVSSSLSSSSSGMSGTILEGPLSDSTLASSPGLGQSAAAAIDSEEGLAKMVEGLQEKWLRRMHGNERQNPVETTTSSSGGSAALAELKSKLEKMEIPQLERLTTSDESTFARVTELQNDSPAASRATSSLQLSEDGQEEEADGSEAVVTEIILSSDSEEEEK